MMIATSRCALPALRAAPFLPALSYGASKPLQCRQAFPRRLSLPSYRIVAQKPPDLYKALGVAVQTARDALEAGTKLVPESVPRPVAQAGVAVLGIVGGLYLLQSLFSVALFMAAIGVVGYYLFFIINKDDDGRGGGGGPSDGNGTDLTLEEARRIMEKYK